MANQSNSIKKKGTETNMLFPANSGNSIMTVHSFAYSCAHIIMLRQMQAPADVRRASDLARTIVTSR